MTKKTVLFITSFFLVSIFLVGCNNNNDNTLNEKKISIMQQIKERGKVVVATEAALEPVEFVQDGKIVGYGADILEEIVKNMDVKLDQKDVPFNGILAGLEERKFDFIATALTVTPERQEKFGMTTPILDGTFVVVTLDSNNNINEMNDLNGKNIGGAAGSAVDAKHKEVDIILKSSGKQGFNEIKQYQSHPDMYLDLKNGRVDAIVVDDYLAKVLMKKNPNTYKIAFTYGDKAYLSWATRKEDEDLLEFLNEEILKLKKSGKLEELQKKWFGNTFDLPENI